MKKIHYAWVICIAGTLVLFITMGTVSNGFSIFMPYIMKEYGLTNTQTSSLTTLRCFSSFFAMLAIGKYYKKFSIRTGVTIAASFAVIAFLVYSQSKGYAGFCIGSVISGLAYGLGSMIPVSILINKWFESHKTLALGICSAGSGFGAVLLPPITTALIARTSMIRTFEIEAGAIALVVLLIFLTLRNDPKEMGLLPLGYDETAKAGKAKPEKTKAGAVIRKKKRSISKKALITAYAMCVLLGCVGNTGFLHLSILFSSSGFGGNMVATLLSIAGFSLIVGKILFGSVTDRFGGFKSCLLFSVFILIGDTVCCMAPLTSGLLSTLGCIILGMGLSVSTMGPSIWANDIMCRKHYGATVRRFQILYAAGSLIFGSVPGIIADIFGGSYVPAYIMFTVFSAIIILMTVSIYKNIAKTK